MDRERWARIREIFGHLADKSPTHRRDYLEMVCEDDADLRREVEELLEANDSMADEQAPWTADTEPAGPSEVGDYIILEHLGSGGMGTVYRASHPHHGEVALKLLPRFTVADPTAAGRFRQEARVLESVSHPALCRLMDAFVDDDYAGLAMELVEGVELTAVLAERPMPYAPALEVIRTLTEVLHLAHEHGILHRDVKPSNVLLEPGGQVKLIDFGIAKFADTRLTATGQVLGTPSYMSPEQWRGEAVDARTDLWALGLLLYEMLSGRRAFAGDDMVQIAARVLGEAPEPLPAQSCDGVALDAAASLIERLLNKAPAGRPADAAELLVRLEALMPAEPSEGV